MQQCTRMQESREAQYEQQTRYHKCIQWKNEWYIYKCDDHLLGYGIFIGKRAQVHWECVVNIKVDTEFNPISTVSCLNTIVTPLKYILRLSLLGIKLVKSVAMKILVEKIE